MEVLVEKKVCLLLGGIGKEQASGSKTPPKVRMTVGWIRSAAKVPSCLGGQSELHEAELLHTFMYNMKSSSSSARVVAMRITAIDPLTFMASLILI